MTNTKNTTNSEFAYQIEHAPAYASLSIKLRANQTVLVESGAMAAMDSSIQMKSKAKGGLMKGIGRVLSGESLFVSEFTAANNPGELMISPRVPGDIQYYRLDGSKSLMVQSSGFVAASPSIQIDTKFQGAKGFFSGESLFLLRASGTGDFWFSSYGGILEIPVSEEYVVDTGYIVAFEETLQYQVELLSGLSFKGLRTGFLGGEGLVCRFKGTGKLWIQSRQLYPLINFFQAFRPTRN
ncbi:TIGR00266 family protein [Leptolyngbya sp. FACHB-711]|uniref:TIGR00266 family protein n=1 Tax=unclassified Leptolyngbya TaxID=2650499 RepID=UPI00168300CA|nr:TIGR00266 family protein [Leptolyngbya sp. FACHB-711]MBD1850027.1 TIGR00266 family protein [Cyanobacteria bacterium FACHB-502]MBD2025403.1 TIGR00266 family protein [Leptolyngbya sp. FACHB-711]